MERTIQGLIQYLKACTSPYHGAAVSMDILKSEGFQELFLAEDWTLMPGGKYCVSCHGTMAVGFTVGESFSAEDGFRISAAHLDWPCLYIKPHPEQTAGGCLKLAVEPYGGLLLHTWMDRPLSCAGQVVLKGSDPLHPITRLFDFGTPLFTIPNLAIHMNREANKGVALSPAKDMLPLAGTVEASFNKDGYFLKKLAEAMDVAVEDILCYDLVLYNAEEPCLLGFDKELLSAPRIDDLSSAYACLCAITAPQRSKGVNIAALFDNEEVGSMTKSGANSGTLGFIMEKIAYALGMNRRDYLNALLHGFVLSSDVAHALHPNKMESYDTTVNAKMNGGVTLKMAYSQSYSTQAACIGSVEALCKANDIPYQRFMNRPDSRGGGTLGGFLASSYSMPTVDIGVPMLAMHSSRELMGVKDIDSIIALTSAFFK